MPTWHEISTAPFELSLPHHTDGGLTSWSLGQSLGDAMAADSNASNAEQDFELDFDFIEDASTMGSFPAEPAGTIADAEGIACQPQTTKAGYDDETEESKEAAVPPPTHLSESRVPTSWRGSGQEEQLRRHDPVVANSVHQAIDAIRAGCMVVTLCVGGGAASQERVGEEAKAEAGTDSPPPKKTAADVSDRVFGAAYACAMELGLTSRYTRRSQRAGATVQLPHVLLTHEPHGVF